MADGVVEIDVKLDTGNAEGELDRFGGKAEKTGAKISDIAKALGLVKIASAAFNVLSNSLDGAITRFDTMQKFPKVMEALGYSTEQSDAAMKKLSNGIEGLPTTLQDVVAQTQQMTAVTGDLDRSTDTVIALNNAFLASGASTDDAARGLQQFNQMLATGTVDLESWKTLQETMPLALQKTAEAMGFVGKTAQRDLYDALKKGTVTFDEFQDALIKLGTGTGELADLAQKNSLGIKTSFQNLSTSVVKGLANVITKIDEITQKVTGKSIAQNIDSLKGIINAAFESIVNSMDSIIPVINIVKGTFEQFFNSLGNTKSSMGSFSSNMGLMGLSFGTLKYTAMEFAPQFLQVFSDLFSNIQPILTNMQEAIGIWGKAFGEIAEQVFPVFLESVLNTFNSLNEFVMPILQTLSDGFLQLSTTLTSVLVEQIVPALLTFYEKFSETFNQILEVVMPIIDEILQSIIEFVSLVIESFGKLFEGDNSIVNSFMNAFNSIVEVALPILQSALDLIKSILADLVVFWQENGTQISNIVKVAFELISTVIQTTMNYIGPFLQTAWENIKNVVEMVWDAIKGIVEAALNIIEGILNTVMGIIDGDWTRAWEGIKQTCQGVLDLIVALIENALNGIGTAFEVIFNTISTTVTSGWETITSLFKSGVEAIKSAFDVDWGSVGSNIIQGIVGGISGAVGSLVDAATNAAMSAFNAAKNALGIHSPSRLFRDGIGRFIPEGVAAGVDKYANKASNAVKDMADSLDNKIGTNFSDKLSKLLESDLVANLPNLETILSLGKATSASSVQPVSNSSSSNVTNISNKGLFDNATIVIREEADIEKIAQALEKKQRKNLRTQGGMA